MDLLTISITLLGGGTVGIFVQKLLMGKKDAADIAQGMVQIMFDQQQKMSAKIETLESEQHKLRLELTGFVAENKKLRNEVELMEKQIGKYSQENAKLRTDLNELEKRYQTLLKDYKALTLNK